MGRLRACHGSAKTARSAMQTYTVSMMRALQLRRWPLRARLALLVVVSILPLLALGVVVQYTRYLDDRGAAGQGALDAARAVAAIVGREFEADIRALEVLAQAPSLRAGDLDAFRASALAVENEFLPGSTILLVREDGQQVLNTSAPAGAPLPKRRYMENMREVLKTGRPRVSDVYFAQVLKRPVVSIEVPVRDADGHIGYTLTLNPAPQILSRILEEEARPGYVVCLGDRGGVLISRTPDGDRFVGHPMAREILNELGSGSEAIFETKSLEGIPILTGITHVEPFGWTVLVGIPRSKYMAPVIRSAGFMVAAIAFVLVLGLLLARSVARQITGPIAQLRAFTSLPRGTVAVPMKTGLPEADELADVMGRYIDERNAAEQELTALNEGLAERIAEAVSERDAVQARLAQSQKMESVGQLTGGIAHDFNNLLTAVIGNLQLIQRNASKDGGIAKFAGRALQAADRGATLVSQLLAFGRRQMLAPERMSIDDAIADVWTLIYRAAGESIQVEIETDPQLWPCHVDKAQFQSAILNLVINARDAMPNGGVVTIVAKNQIIGSAGARALDIPPGEYVRTAVSDTGTGMSAEVVAQAFDPFFTTKEVGKGSGLGLSQVYGFARQSGGTAVIESTPGNGTTVAVILPRAVGASARKEVAEGAPALAQTDHHVLVVEDQGELRDLAEMLLRDLGYRTMAAESAESALDVLRNDPSVDVLFSDVVLGGAIDGAELAVFAREMRPGLKVLLTSGYPDRINRHPLGAVEFLRKPYRRDDLATAIHRLFRTRSAA
jgi:signal transduction histidine kinase/CheY-like chemotaxis protein